MFPEYAVILVRLLRSWDPFFDICRKLFACKEIPHNLCAVFPKAFAKKIFCDFLLTK